MEKYSIIYADPPWKYDREVGEGVAATHYNTMPIEEICNLPVREIADSNSLLFLWVTFPKLVEGLKLIQAWGFQYKTVAFVWVKLNKKKETPFFGLGNWTRSNAETGQTHEKIKIAYSNNSVYDTVKEKQRSPV